MCPPSGCTVQGGRAFFKRHIFFFKRGARHASNIGRAARTKEKQMARHFDRKTVDGLVIEHLPAALRFASRLSGDPHIAEDVV